MEPRRLPRLGSWVYHPTAPLPESHKRALTGQRRRARRQGKGKEKAAARGVAASGGPVVSAPSWCPRRSRKDRASCLSVACNSPVAHDVRVLARLRSPPLNDRYGCRIGKRGPGGWRGGICGARCAPRPRTYRGRVGGVRACAGGFVVRACNAMRLRACVRAGGR